MTVAECSEIELGLRCKVKTFVTISTDKCFLEYRLTLIELELILYFVLILLNCNMKKCGKSRVVCRYE